MVPKKTFFNLAARKRERFVKAAMDEFARHDYRGASVSRIVKKAGIAKGSVYQYFETKKDLYSYLVSRAAETKFGFIDRAVPATANGFFERFKLTAFHGARFDFDHPRLAGVLYNATYKPSGPEATAVSMELRRTALEYIRRLVEAGVQDGELRGDTDVEFATFALYQLTVSLRDYLAYRFGFSFEDAVRRGSANEIDKEDLLSTLEALTELFVRGIGTAPRQLG